MNQLTATFRRLHTESKPLCLANAWDAGSRPSPPPALGLLGLLDARTATDSQYKVSLFLAANIAITACWCPQGREEPSVV